MLTFEVNTDIALIDPDWEVFEQLHDQRYGLAISYLKHVVKGDTFDNQVMDLKISERGFYVQSKNFPAAFYGDTANVGFSFISESEVQGVIFDAVSLYRSGDARSLTCIYNDAQPPDFFFGYRLNGEEVYHMNSLRMAPPLHLRVMVEAKEEVELLGACAGAIIYQRTLDGRHLLIRAPGRKQPFPLGDAASPQDTNVQDTNVQDTNAQDAPQPNAVRARTLARTQTLPLLDGFSE
jgi:hypothetical protein